MSERKTPEEWAAIDKAWIKAFKKKNRRGGPLNFIVDAVEAPFRAEHETYVLEAVVTAPGVVFDDVVEILVPDILPIDVVVDSSNYQVLLQDGFVFPEIECEKGPFYKPYNLLATMLQNSKNMFYNGEKVVDLIVPTYGVSPLPRKYMRNLSVLMRGTRVIATGSGSFSLMGCAECPGDEDEAIVMLTMSSGKNKAVLVSAMGVNEVLSQEVAYFRRDSSTGIRYLVHPFELETSVPHKRLVWVESLTAPGIVCVDGQFFSVPLCRFVHLRSVQTEDGSRLMTRNCEVIFDLESRFSSDVVQCNLDSPLSTKSAPYHNPQNVATIEVVHKLRDSVVYHEMRCLYRTCEPVTLDWNCQGFGVSYSDPKFPSLNLEQVRKRRHKCTSILLCMAHAVNDSSGFLTVFDVYKQMQLLPEIFIYGRNYQRYSWSGICDDFYRYSHSSRLQPLSSYYVRDAFPGGFNKISLPSEVINVLVVCRSNFTLRGMNRGKYFSDAHLRMWLGKSDIVPILWSLQESRAIEPKIFIYDMTFDGCRLELVSKGVRCFVELEPDNPLEEDDND